MGEPILETLRPLNTKELAIKAQDFEFNPSIPLKYWIRTSDTLLREALIYKQEGNDQQAYLLLMRYAALVAEKFPLHPSFKDPEYEIAFKSIKKNLSRVLDSMEVLKPRINNQSNAWETVQNATPQNHSWPAKTWISNIASPSDPAITANTSTLNAAQNRELAVKLARKEINRRHEVRNSIHQPKKPINNGAGNQAAGLLNVWDLTSLSDELSQESRRMSSTSHYGIYDYNQEKPTNPKLSKSLSSSNYRYPTVEKSQPFVYQFELPRRPNPSLSLAPDVPPKDFIQKLSTTQEISPPRPQKLSTDNKIEPPIPSKDSSPVFTFRPSSYLENGTPLRTIFLPPGLRIEFLKYAEPNTKKNLETCGMLCGTLISNALFISRVVIPEQESTCDTCETTNEGALFDYCDKEDLLVLGWIHTHPTQTCFMSSRDLHTHCGYQIMMPESIAIVCAPSRNPSWGVFRLTDPPGLGSILNCTHSGIFHPHSETNLYTNALRPGHVVEAEGMDFKVVDIRPL